MNKNLKKPSSNKIITKYLNRYLMSNFKLKHLNITNEKINILKVENDLSLLIDINNKKQKIFFGELI